jgi:hypothetical protein
MISKIMKITTKITLIAIVLTTAITGFAAGGNGAPSGTHYNLNIIGVKNDKTPDMTNSSGHVIFVNEFGKTAIQLQEGPFDVIDANGTDGKATFQLPCPDPLNSGTTTYSVYVRALGKPGGSSTITPYIVDTDGSTWYSAANVTVTRTKGKTTFTNVSKELLYVYVDLTDDGIDNPTRIPLFGDKSYQYFWDYDNTGLKLAQFRFYPISTNVN